MNKKKKPDGKPNLDHLEIVSTKSFKLKDKPGREFVAIHINNQFGFVPEVIMIEKVRGSNNKFVVRGVIEKAKLKDNKKGKNESTTTTSTKPTRVNKPDSSVPGELPKTK